MQTNQAQPAGGLSPPRFTARDLFRILFRRKWIMLLCLAVVLASVVVASRRMTPLYRANATLRVRMHQKTISQSIDQYVDKQPIRSMDVLVQTMRSDTVLERVVTHPDLRLDQEVLRNSPHLTREKAIDQAVNKLSGGRLQVIPQAGNQIEVIGIWEDKVRAANLANTLCEVFLEYRFEDDKRDALMSVEYFREELDAKEAQVAELKKKVEGYKVNNEMPQEGRMTIQLQEDLRHYQNTRRGLEVKLATLRQRTEAIQEELDSMNEVDPEAGEYSEEVLAVRKERFSREMELDALLKRYTEKHPDVRRAQQEIERLKNREEEIIASYRPAASMGQQQERQALYQEMREAELTAAELSHRLKETGVDLKRVRKQLEALPKKEMDLQQLIREYELAMLERDRLQQELAAARRTVELRNQEAAAIQVLDRAKPPSSPFYPDHRKNYFLGVVGGFAFALAVAFLLEFMNHSLETTDDVHQHVGVPVLGTVPVMRLR